MNNRTMRLLTELRELPSDDLVTLSGGLGLLHLVLCAVIGANADGEAVFSSPWWWGFTAIVWLVVVAFAIRAAALRDQDN